MQQHAHGVFIVTQTPFQDNGAIDLPSVDSLVDFYIEHGANGLTVLGVAGESVKLNLEESTQVAQRFIQRAEGRPVVVGVSNASLVQLTDLSKRAMDLGAAGVMIAPPTGLKTDEDIFNYFAAVFRSIGDTPTVLQDFPFSTGVWMSVPLMARLIEAFPQIQVVKEEDLPSITKITKMRQALPASVRILTGNNAMFLPLELGRGIDGPMAGFSHPEMLSGVYAHWQKGEIDAAHALFNLYLPLLSYENQSQWGVAVRKEILKRRGAIRSAVMRSPGPVLTATDMGEIDLLLQQLNQRLAAATR